jgi:excisionase family DNA binding protein
MQGPKEQLKVDGVKDTAPAENPALLTRKVAAARLSISTRTLDRLASSGSIERVLLGTAVRFRAADISKIVDRGI